MNVYGIVCPEHYECFKENNVSYMYNVYATYHTKHKEIVKAYTTAYEWFLINEQKRGLITTCVYILICLMFRWTWFLFEMLHIVKSAQTHILQYVKATLLSMKSTQMMEVLH